MPTYNSAGRNSEGSRLDRGSFGGTAESWSGPNGEIHEEGSAQKATQRYQGLGAAAGARQAYQPDYQYAAQSRQMAGQSRDQQGQALALQMDAARGNAPSRAEILGRQQIDQGLQAQMAGAASARGGPLAQAAAMRQAQTNAAAQQQQGTQQISAMRAEEMAGARNAAMAGASGMRAGDQQGQALDLQTTQQWAQNEQAQRQLNQQGQMGYEQMAWNTQKAQQDGMLHADQISHDQWKQQTNLDQHSQDRETGVIGGIVGGIGSVAGLFSDEHTKIPVLMRDNPYGESLASDPKGLDLPSASSPSGAPSGRKQVNDYDTAATPYKAPADGKGSGLGALGGAMKNIGSGIGQWSDENTKDMLSNPGGTTQLGAGGGMDVMGSLKANSDIATSFVKKPGGAGGAMASPMAMSSDERTKESPEQLKSWAKGELSKLGADDGDWARGELARLEAGKRAPAAVGGAPDDGAWAKDQLGRLAAAKGLAPAVDPVADANRAQAAQPYAYKPEFRPPEQAPGEVNVGPMAQDMARNPVSATAVKRDPSTGMLLLDKDKLAKVHSAGIASLQQQLDQTRATLAALVAQRGGK